MTTKLEELKASLEAAWAVLDAAKASTNVARGTAWAAWVAYEAELEKQKENFDE